MSVINAVAEFERDLLIERTQAGLRRAKAEGKKLGRPRALDNKQEQEAMAMRQAGNSLAAVASALGVSRSAIQRIEQRQAQ
jgi:putative DNA-invertase from lambdoid prophage Rac